MFRKDEAIVTPADTHNTSEVSKLNHLICYGHGIDSYSAEDTRNIIGRDNE